MNSNDLIERLDEHASYLQAFEEEGQTMIERQCIAAMSEASTLIQSQAAEIARLTGLALSPKGHPMTTQPKQDAIVSQRDREIAADIWRDYVAKVGEIIAERCMREGGLDDGLPSIVATYRAEIEAATIERCEQLMHVIDRDRYIVAHGVNQIRAAIDGHSWLLEGRGPYEWDDDRYRDEFGDAVKRIEAAMEPLRRVAWDKSDCTRITERVIAAKEAASEMLKQPIGPREMIATDIMPAVCSECSRNLKGQTS